MRMKRKLFEPVSNGTHAVILVDVEELGLLSSAYGTNETLRLTFATSEKDAGGKTKLIRAFCSANSHPDSKLTEYARALLGKDPGMDWETEDLLGHGCKLATEITTNAKGKTFSKVTSVARLGPKDKAPSVPLSFVRAKNRKPAVVRKKSVGTNIHGLDASDSDVPLALSQ